MLLGYFFRMPLVTVKVITAIHWQAFRLWTRGYHTERRLPILINKKEYSMKKNVSMWNNVYRRLLLRTLNKMNKGQLTLTLPDKEVIRIGDGLGIHATCRYWMRHYGEG